MGKEVEHLDTKALRIVREETLLQLQSQKGNVDELRETLEKINTKLHKKQSLSEEDLKVLSSAGWLTSLSIAIAALATSL